MKTYKRAMATIICVCLVAGAISIGFSLWKHYRERRILISYAPPASNQEHIDFPININEAAVEDLMRIPEIGEVKARSIIEYREANGRFQGIEDITKVSGIGEKTFAHIAPLITCQEESK